MERLVQYFDGTPSRFHRRRRAPRGEHPAPGIGVRQIVHDDAFVETDYLPKLTAMAGNCLLISVREGLALLALQLRPGADVMVSGCSLGAFSAQTS